MEIYIPNTLVDLPGRTGGFARTCTTVSTCHLNIWKNMKHVLKPVYNSRYNACPYYPYIELSSISYGQRSLHIFPHLGPKRWSQGHPTAEERSRGPWALERWQRWAPNGYMKWDYIWSTYGWLIIQPGYSPGFLFWSHWDDPDPGSHLEHRGVQPRLQSVWALFRQPRQGKQGSSTRKHTYQIHIEIITNHIKSWYSCGYLYYDYIYNYIYTYRYILYNNTIFNIPYIMYLCIHI